ncbi:glycogen debranching protein [Cesiribacter sp. SM1]|uniref:alpha-L-rhamnosidase-related protein n=1 Tax=Cesiribacter sp. SM1 TaxID=2861196 RepID=UPI001CD51939|nr:glycogen debranching protein [Cesiribacter sp. SM1]
MEPLQSSSERELYESGAFTVFGNRVKQGLYEAVALSPTSMVSNYQSPANDRHSRGISFKFSLNGKDNELPVGINHFVVLYPERGKAESPLITFGQTYTDTKPVPKDDFLEPNTAFRIRLDMRPVLQQFEDHGFYTDYAGNRVYRQDFSGVYVAGDAEPLSWDFENLPAREGAQLTDHDGNGIYEITIILNQYNPADFTANHWELEEDISKYPQFSSNLPLIDALYNLSLEEINLDTESDGTFRTGKEWEGVWTRDISYSIVLALAAIEPEISRNSLMAKVRDGRIIQDTGTGGSWPVSTDRTTWALAAWEVYAVTGDEGWLRESYEIIRKTVEEDLLVASNGQTGLFKGESSFLDWRIQSYPRWMGPVAIYISESLGTNVVHFETYQILARMGQRLGEPTERWQHLAQRIKQGINERLWQPERGFYGQFLYGNAHLVQSPRAEALGEALSVLYGVADQQQSASIVSRMPLTKFGATSIYPQIPDVPPYHNQGIWPFVQAYWNWAAAALKNEPALLHGLGALYRATALFLTNKENLVANSGDYKGTEINSDRQLWSVAGTLAMVYRIFYGMHFEPEGIRLNPVVPQAYADSRRLSNFRYRNAVLTLEISGWGTQVAEVLLDGERLQEALIPANLQGEHQVEIRLANNSFENQAFSLVANHTSLATPEVQVNQQSLEWEPVEGAVAYQVWCNGALLQEVSSNRFELQAPLDVYAEYMVAAVDAAGWPSFHSEPLSLVSHDRLLIIEAEQIVTPADLSYEGYNGKGFIELSKTANTYLSFNVEAPAAGEYLVDVHFSNGSGPVNTDNKAAIRSLYVEDTYAGPLVMPQLGKEEWSNWAFSNPLGVRLRQGSNQLHIRFMPWNENMNGAVNRAMLDFVRLIRL